MLPGLTVRRCRVSAPTAVNNSAVNILITVQQIQLTRTRSHNLLLLLLILKRNEMKKNKKKQKQKVMPTGRRDWKTELASELGFNLYA